MSQKGRSNVISYHIFNVWTHIDPMRSISLYDYITVVWFDFMHINVTIIYQFLAMDS